MRLDVIPATNAPCDSRYDRWGVCIMIADQWCHDRDIPLQELTTLSHHRTSTFSFDCFRTHVLT